MACQTNAGLASAAAGRLGLSRLSSKQAFFAGLTLGATGAGLGALLVARRQGGSPTPRQALAIAPPAGKPARKKQPKPIPALAAGPQTKPIPGLSTSRPTGAKPIPGLSPSGRAGVRPIQMGSSTTLQPAAVELATDRGEPLVAKNSYRVMQADGSDSGLALTPHLSEGTQKPSEAWSLTHTATGKRVAGPFASLEQTHRLATQLSPLGWRGPLLSRAKRAEPKRLIEVHRQTVAEENQ